jgi:hypothetical protein
MIQKKNKFKNSCPMDFDGGVKPHMSHHQPAMKHGASGSCWSTHPKKRAKPPWSSRLAVDNQNLAFNCCMCFVFSHMQKKRNYGTQKLTE